MIECPAEVEIMNKDHEICTLDNGAKLSVEFTVENGKGYVSSTITEKMICQLELFLLMQYIVQLFKFHTM